MVGIKHGRFTEGGAPIGFRGIGIGSWLDLEHFMLGLPGVDRGIRRALEARMPGFMRRFEESFFSDEDAAFLKSLGVNMVRVPFRASAVIDDMTGRPLDEGIASLRRLAGICARHGIWFLPDMHAAPGAQNPDWHSGCETGQPLFWRYAALRAQAARAWGLVAEALCDETHLLGYDLLNEPVLWGTDVEGLNAFHAQAAEAIRRHDGAHLLFVEGDRFAMDFTGVTLPDPGRSAYTYHFYPAVWEPALSDPALPRADRRAAFARAHRAILDTMGDGAGPLLCGETGYELKAVGDGPGIEMLDDTVALFEEAGAGWCVWAYKDAGTMGLCVPKADTAWQRLAADVASRWTHNGDMAWGDRTAREISEARFGGALTEGQIYALQFRLRAALFEPEVESLLMPALDRLTEAERQGLAEDFSLARCAVRPLYRDFFLRHCGEGRA